MSQIEGIRNKHFRNSVSQIFPIRLSCSIYQNDHILILHVTACSEYMAIFVTPTVASGAVEFIHCQTADTCHLTLQPNMSVCDENLTMTAGHEIYFIFIHTRSAHNLIKQKK